MEHDPQAQTEYSEDGVDLTLIRWMLSLTPAERLRILEGHASFFTRVREHRRWQTAR